MTRTRQPRMPIEVRREQVLDAALGLIIADGYGAATMEAIARAAGLAKPVVYNAYPGRGALLRALLEREEKRAFDTLAGAMPALPVDVDAMGTLMSWLRGLAYAIAGNPDPWRLILMPADETPEIVREHVKAGRALVFEQLKAVAAEVGERQFAISAIDADLAAHLLLAAVERAAQLLIADPEAFPPQRLADFAESVLRSVLL